MKIRKINEDTFMETKPEVGTFEDLCKYGSGWEVTEWNLFEDLFNSYYDEEYVKLEEEYTGKPFKVGDIIMTMNSETSSSGSNFTTPHRIYVITSTVDKDGIQHYSGYQLSSAIKKSNKYIMQDGGRDSNWWKSNIYINNYSTILERGAKSPTPAFIDLGTRYTFTNKDLAEGGVWKGHVSNEFADFAKDIRDKLRRGEDTSEIYWEK